MKKFVRIMTAFLFASIGLSLVSCSGSNKKTIEYAKTALEKSGVREVFFEPYDFYERKRRGPEKDEYPYSLFIKKEKYNERGALDNPDLRVQSPLYFLEWDQSGHRFLSAKAKGASFKDDDALTEGTLAFMETGIYRHKTYKDSRGKLYSGEQEYIRVLLYDLSSGNFIADKKFYGKELKDRESYSGSKSVFVNKVSRKEIDDWIDSLR